MRRNHQTHAGTAGRTALYARIAHRLGVPHAEEPGKPGGFAVTEIARQMAWLERAEAAECRLGRTGSWAHDANRLLALRQARELARDLARELARELAQEPGPDQHPAPVNPSRGSFQPARDGQAR